MGTQVDRHTDGQTGKQTCTEKEREIDTNAGKETPFVNLFFVALLPRFGGRARCDSPCLVVSYIHVRTYEYIHMYVPGMYVFSPGRCAVNLWRLCTRLNFYRTGVIFLSSLRCHMGFAAVYMGLVLLHRKNVPCSIVMHYAATRARMCVSD